MVEPWLRGTHTELPAVVRQVVHALELAVEDQVRWCGGLSEKEMEAKPLGLPSVGFQMRHMVRSLDRLLTYAEGGGLSDGQMEALRAEHDGGMGVAEEFRLGMLGAEERVMALAGEDFEAVRYVGRDRLATTVGGLLVHCAEHTQRHTGQMVSTAKVMVKMRVG